MKKVLILLAIVSVFSGCGVEGIHSANPRTIIRYNTWSKQFEVENNKNVDLTVEGLEVDVPKNITKMEKMVLKDNASEVREVNPGQIDAVSRQSALIQATVVSGVEALFGWLRGSSITSSNGSLSIVPVAADTTALETAITKLTTQITTMQEASDKTTTAVENLNSQITTVQEANQNTAMALTSVSASVEVLGEQVAAIEEKINAEQADEAEETTTQAAE